ncbi:hypothetical protein CI102_12312 [Trichoderma harzianum]|nr:hypothetical protein CI102_12312 [Trichoderma harzianum]
MENIHTLYSTPAQYSTSTSTMALDAAADRGIIVVAKPRHTRDIDQTYSIFLLLLPGHAQPRPRHAYACSGTTESNPSGSYKSHCSAGPCSCFFPSSSFFMLAVFSLFHQFQSCLLACRARVQMLLNSTAPEPLLPSFNEYGASLLRWVPLHGAPHGTCLPYRPSFSTSGVIWACIGTSMYMYALRACMYEYE